ncbi:hypothetical protein PGT21_028374 [Puccinia graminis f. sp. tritici]|uniref:Uncharacterized protein n=1 Tax=Puccinia graminis f. sp. tritici TaxID=56615 RepID=A0A5B0S4X2_PUCGR|nr:hypothetical protein PGT21_028374 [Puccinia graminis f. sp. tritici]KAA1133000.1 hypothetical protein PGTUg99_020551 [Puccinia graminis f. sp. tritici]
MLLLQWLIITCGLMTPAFSLPMVGESAGKSAAQDVPAITAANTHTEEPVVGTSAKKFTSSDSPDPQNSLRSQPTNADEIEKNSLAQACHPNETTDQASKAKLEKQDRFFEVFMAGTIPAFISLLFMLGNPEPSDRLCTCIWCFFTFLWVYLSSLGSIIYSTGNF